MTLRLLMVMVYWSFEFGFFLAAIITNDAQKRQTRLLFAIWWSLCSMSAVIGAIAIHVGAYPLWNNK